MYIPIAPLPSIKFLLNLFKHLGINFSGWNSHFGEWKWYVPFAKQNYQIEFDEEKYEK